MVEIIGVEPGSIAEELSITAGDSLLEIDGKEVNDYIDYQYGISADFFVLTVKKKDGEIWEFEIEKGADENLGLIFRGIIFDQLKTCKNNCLFCFVKQQPKGMRNSLVIKDDDYRFSFLQGSFITLTNLEKKDYQRIIKLKLSPLYISVHTTNPELRGKMMKNPVAVDIMEQLSYLRKNGISFHTQLVLCPGYNDGVELDRTINDLITLYPQLLSIGIVPVGLTNYRDKLPLLNRFDYLTARRAIEQIKKWQKKLKVLYRTNFIFASDELYFLANVKIPTLEEYKDFPQVENGIGLTRLLWEEFSKISLPAKVNNITVGVITGVLGKKALEPIIKSLQDIPGLDINIIPVENKFFGKSVTVTGLLTGQDILNKIKDLPTKPGYIVIPNIVLNSTGHFLDNLTRDDIKKEFPEINIQFVDNLKDMVEVLING